MRLTDGVVLLRPWTEDDVAWLVEATNDAEIVHWTRVPPDNDAEKVRAFIHGAEGVHLGIVDAATGERLGTVGLVRPDEEAARVEIGYWIVAGRRGRGIAPRAVRLLGEWALSEGGFQRVELHADAENRASRRVAEKCGFELEGILRGYEVINGRRSDVAMYARLRVPEPDG